MRSRLTSSGLLRPRLKSRDSPVMSSGAKVPAMTLTVPTLIEASMRGPLRHFCRIGQRDVLRAFARGGENLQAVVHAEGVGVAREQPEAALADGVAAGVVGEQGVALARGSTAVMSTSVVPKVLPATMPARSWVSCRRLKRIRSDSSCGTDISWPGLEVEAAGNEVVAQPGGAAHPQLADSRLHQADAHRAVGDRLRRQDRPGGGLMTVVVEAVDRADQVVQILQADHGALQRASNASISSAGEDLRAIDREAPRRGCSSRSTAWPRRPAWGADLRRTWHLLQTLLALLALEIFLLLLLDRAGSVLVWADTPCDANSAAVRMAVRRNEVRSRNLFSLCGCSFHAAIFTAAAAVAVEDVPADRHQSRFRRPLQTGAGGVCRQIEILAPLAGLRGEYLSRILGGVAARRAEHHLAGLAWIR